MLALGTKMLVWSRTPSRIGIIVSILRKATVGRWLLRGERHSRTPQHTTNRRYRDTGLMEKW